VTSILGIETNWERLDSGAPEERACFAALSIRFGQVCLTEADDRFVGRVRQDIPLSAYKMAEWLAWNWWRLRWESRRDDEGWRLAHRMTTIGGGYVWPNITVVSDGERVALIAKPTQARATEPVRYISDVAVVVQAAEFEGMIDNFLAQVCGQLRSENICDTNVDRLWAEISEERRDPEATKWRKFEAMAGYEPGEAPSSIIESLIADAGDLGQGAVAEVATSRAAGEEIVSAVQLREHATSMGFVACPSDAVRLSSPLSPLGDKAAWKRGAEAAGILRKQEQLGAAPISNQRLGEMAGVRKEAITNNKSTTYFSFALDETQQTGHVAFRSKWEAGRRFELARLLGDRIAGWSPERLYPATRGHTYRQKFQRSFAAELLCPFDALNEMLRRDYSLEAIEDAAAHFTVSERTIRTLLVNHGCLDREDLERDIETISAA